MEPTTRLDRHLGFLLTADRLKRVERSNRLHDGSRFENSAEHSWHLCLMALTLAEHAPPGTDIGRVVEMLVVHDVVEIDAGDHWVVAENAAAVAAKEAAAAERLFALLPDDQHRRFHALWTEYEARATAEARFARALDSLHPMLLVWGPGASDEVHVPVTAAFMREHKRAALEPYPALWVLAQSLLDGAVARGVLAP
ncbi:MAG: HD domain-containing protein [Thalassobaculum sp.]|uniref:HD domain-containing protein n=1 Tax=Thalassobaculum sp. TaxID=2022740 RepID=UPI0032EB6F6A